MGRTYSLNGYLNAVLQRSSRTLLVEGVTDKAALHRLVAERQTPGRRQFSIDHSALFDDKLMHGQGAKAKVLQVQTEALKLTPKFAKLSTSLAYLTDREWDGLPGDPVALVEAWEEPPQLNSSFVTIGHSIENYHFHADCFVDYLRFGFAEHFSPDLEAKIRTVFPSAIALAGAVSCAARSVHCVTRLSGLLGSTHVELNAAGRFYLAKDAIAPIQTRCGIDATSFVAGVNGSVDSHWAVLSNNPNSRWVLHGHVGSEVLWGCIGLAATKVGTPTDVGEQIARGFQQERRRCWLTWLTRVTPQYRTPLDRAVNWLLLLPAEAGA